MNFESILIVTYPRSGSTLLQGILNTVDGVLIRGENFNFCFHLFNAYRSILKTNAHSGKLVQDPYFGAEILDEQHLLSEMSKLTRNMLLADHKVNKIRMVSQRLKKRFYKKENYPADLPCYGFKEVRYMQTMNEFPEYLAFLEKIFPKPCFVINTRDKNAVIESSINAGYYLPHNKEKIFNKLQDIEAVFFDFLQTHKHHAFHISYEDIMGKTDRFSELFSFIGAPYNEQKIDKVLSLRHSYKPNQESVKKLKYK